MPEPTATRAAQGDANYKDTIESILIAFILAFIFRAFVVEAYVIPTGSMAPTLYGAHMRFKCPDCGYTFDAGVRGDRNAAGDDLNFPSDAKPDINFHCPNCGYSMDTTLQPIRFGDRILVMKYLYLFQKPVPGDVVVFKSPNEENLVPEDPEYGTNYIKRLIGVGPESIVILDGDVYTGAYDANGPLAADGKTPAFKIQRKPAHVQDALWRVIFNNDFIPHLGVANNPWQQPWEEESPASGWNTHGGVSSTWPSGAPSRAFGFSNPAASGAIVFNSDSNPDTHALTDYLVYDESEHRDKAHQDWRPLYVSDLKLSADYIRKSGDGPLRLQLSKNADLFTAEVSPGTVRLLRAKRVAPDRSAIVDETELQSAAISNPPGARPMRVELINVDYRVSVRIDGKEILATTDAQYSPNVAELWRKEDQEDMGSGDQGAFARPLVRIEAARQESRVDHVVLSRDIYYLSHRQISMPFWATTRKISHLGDGEYFVMGDNSFISGDARYWNTPIKLPREHLDVESGRVPERFMLGKAFFVYWPAGYRFSLLPLNAVPDFGEMRSIR
ncbi:MAG TPA: S26 family signal peptidase [Tepidisphaeraceae bacterium]|nr:S26 family signal peptidase [Tepidisphaeraceae bacterium]